jgi:CheY-like chemotaxis protein
VLVTEDRPYGGEHWTRQLTRLLEPQGVAAYVVPTGRQALELASQLEFHAAVIDLGTPMGSLEGFDAALSPARLPPKPAHGAAGVWLLELIRRLPNQPPVVVVNGPAVSDAEVARSLSQALKLGAFSVLHKPIELEQLLAVFQRLVDRHYRGAWPTFPPPRKQ